MATLYVFYNPSAHTMPPGAMTHGAGDVILDGKVIGSISKHNPCLQKQLTPGAHLLINPMSKRGTDSFNFSCPPRQKCYIMEEISGWSPPWRASSVSAAEAQPWI